MTTLPTASCENSTLAFLSMPISYSLPSKPTWRNWQTRRTQNPVPARECGFDPLRRHTKYQSGSADDSDPEKPAIIRKITGHLPDAFESLFRYDDPLRPSNAFLRALANGVAHPESLRVPHSSGTLPSQDVRHSTTLETWTESAAQPPR
jgi:hypothetical protein